MRYPKLNALPFTLQLRGGCFCWIKSRNRSNQERLARPRLKKNSHVKKNQEGKPLSVPPPRHNLDDKPLFHFPPELSILLELVVSVMALWSMNPEKRRPDLPWGDLLRFWLTSWKNLEKGETSRRTHSVRRKTPSEYRARQYLFLLLVLSAAR